MVRSVRRLGALMAVAAAGLLLTACDPEEQGRVLQYDKGSYLGQPDEEISPETRAALRERARLQSGL